MNTAEPNQPLTEEEFVELLTPVSPRLLDYLFVLLGNRTNADDVMQETVLTMWEKRADFQRGTSFQAWALTTAKFQALSFRRKGHRCKLRFSDALIERLGTIHGELNDSYELEERQTALRSCMKKLHASDRELVERCYAPKAQAKDVAKSLGRSPQSISNSLRRIRQALLRCVKSTLRIEEAAP